MLQIMASPATTPNHGLPAKNQAPTETNAPMITPFKIPSPISFNKTLRAFSLSNSPSDKPRTTIVKVCVPALPPIPVIIGLIVARATTFAIVPSKTLTTLEAIIAVKRLTINQGIRFLKDSTSVESKRSSEPTPPNKFMSSVVSSSMTSITSSISITPNK